MGKKEKNHNDLDWPSVCFNFLKVKNKLMKDVLSILKLYAKHSYGTIFFTYLEVCQFLSLSSVTDRIHKVSMLRVWIM